MRNYLRVRGEYSGIPVGQSMLTELPPRARRIPQRQDTPRDIPGTTSACAENTIGASSRPPAQRNYLRVRGEYRTTPPSEDDWGELPPRARRIPLPTSGSVFFVGTTSACAENTTLGFGDLGKCWNYLRVRGEYGPPPGLPHYQTELPPRARRIHVKINDRARFYRTTSACAENTLNELGLL